MDSGYTRTYKISAIFPLLLYYPIYYKLKPNKHKNNHTALIVNISKNDFIGNLLSLGLPNIICIRYKNKYKILKGVVD